MDTKCKVLLPTMVGSACVIAGIMMLRRTDVAVPSFEERECVRGFLREYSYRDTYSSALAEYLRARFASFDALVGIDNSTWAQLFVIFSAACMRTSDASRVDCIVVGVDVSPAEPAWIVLSAHGKEIGRTQWTGYCANPGLVRSRHLHICVDHGVVRAPLLENQRGDDLRTHVPTIVISDIAELDGAFLVVWRSGRATPGCPLSPLQDRVE